MELDVICALYPENIINANFLTSFNETWQEQLSMLTSPEYLVIKDEVNSLLLEILPTMKNNEVEKIIPSFIKSWIYLSNISMLQYIIKYIKDGIDITLFLGALHMQNLIEELEKLYPSLSSTPSSTSSTYSSPTSSIYDPFTS